MTHPHPHFLRDFAQTRAFTLGRPARPQITADGSAVLFLRSPARSSEHHLYQLDVASGKTELLLRPEDLPGEGSARELSAQERAQEQAQAQAQAQEQARLERQRITDTGFTSFQLSPDASARQVLIPNAGRLYLMERPGTVAPGRSTVSVRLLTAADAPPAIDARFSPDGRWLAFVSAGDLYVLDLTSERPTSRAITSGATGERSFGLAEFVAQEEMARHEGFWWSPASDRLLFAEVDESEVESFTIADPARPERSPVSFRYPRPGRANATVRLGLASVKAGTADAAASPSLTWLKWDLQRYPYVARVLWDSPAAPLAVLVQTRDQREVALLAVDQDTGATSPLVVERDSDWVNLDRDLPRWMPDGSGLLWARETREGRGVDLLAADGSRGRPLLGPEDNFHSVSHLAADGRTLYFLAGDPVRNHVARLDIPSGRRVRLTADPGEHVAVFAREAPRWVDLRTRPDGMPDTRVLSTDDDGVVQAGPLLPSVAEDAPFPIQLELTETGGDPSFRAAIIRPAAFDPARRYPVVLHVYGGPHHLTVRADARNYVLDQWIADHGCVVVALDNRGTPRRGRDWERAIKGALGEVPLADQVAGLQALARRYPELDLERVGVFGWSFGGYLSALAVLRRPDLFKVGVVGAPVVDWRDYDTHYTERYLGVPENAQGTAPETSEAYDRASLLTYAGQLSRPLLLVHGTADDNVYFFHSLKLAEALFRAGKHFDFLPLPRVTHQIADPLLREQLWSRVVRYLVESLLGPGRFD